MPEDFLPKNTSTVAYDHITLKTRHPVRSGKLSNRQKMADFDVVVVGAGIFGTCTAYHCQKLGLKTLLLEKYSANHENGSSHGKSRITRYAHTDSAYVPLVDDAYSQIDELEKKRGEQLWKKTGLLWAATGNVVPNISAVLKTHKVDHEVLQGAEIQKRYPQFAFDNEWFGLVDPMGGVILADKQLNAFRDEYLKLGGQFHDNEEVKNYADGPVVRVETQKRTYTAKKAIFTVGVWIKQFFPKAPLKIEPISISVCYWKAKTGECRDMPVFIGQDPKHQTFCFALPATDYPDLIKMAYHTGDPITDYEHPKESDEKYVSIPRDFIQSHIPAVDGSKAARVDKCKYTVSEDDKYVIGPFPGMKNVLVGGCGSGSGFKVAPAIGRALAEMAAGRPTSVDVSAFSFDRFNKKSKI
ncbi:unnamed protein product [Caenorhabditis auriculariae]|uniref:sarcosine oxidasee (formaldehyde-forming) n=1 Tax=Caenorhabditis auriculariae TaxID=2777116 RepID=A0A8S1HK11_9PELO|nr:unnamed protein product [Caenorhabditis auriculariae]